MSAPSGAPDWMVDAAAALLISLIEFCPLGRASTLQEPSMLRRPCEPRPPRAGPPVGRSPARERLAGLAEALGSAEGGPHEERERTKVYYVYYVPFKAGAFAVRGIPLEPMARSNEIGCSGLQP